MPRPLRRAAAAALLACALAVLAAAPASAELRWSKPAEVGAGSPADVLIDARGDVLAIWHRHAEGTTTVRYAWKPPGGAWTEPRTLPGATHANAVITPRGQATVAWHDDGRLLSADARPGRAFGEPQTIVTGLGREAGTPALATDDAGNLVAAWTFGECRDPEAPERNCGSSVSAATRRPGGAWSDPQSIARFVSGGGVKAAVNASGAAAISFLVANGGEARLSYRQPGGSFGPVEKPPLPSPGIPDLALDDVGRATVSMPSNVLTGRPVGTAVTQRDPLGNWSATHELPASTSSNPFQRMMQVEPSGAVSLLTAESAGEGRTNVQHAVRLPDGTIEGPRTIGPDGASTDSAMNLRGDMLAVWHSPSNDFEGATSRIVVAERPVGSEFGAPAAISAPGAVAPGVAVNDAGQAAVLWAQGGYRTPTAMVAVREDPAAEPLPFPPDVDVELPDVPRLDGDGTLRVAVRCDRSCKASPKGILIPGGGEDLVAARGSSKRLKAGRRTGVTLRFGAERAKDVRRALEAGRKPWVAFTVRARGGSPRPMTVSRRVRLR